MSFVGNDQPGNTLKFALIGMPNSGKSLLYNSISDPLNPQPVDDFMFSTIDPAIAHFRNEDERMDWLVKVFGAATCEYLTSIITDLPGIVHNSCKGEGEGIAFLETCKKTDLLIHVIRGWDDVNLTHYNETVDPARDCDIVLKDLMMYDLIKIEKRLRECYIEQDLLKYNHGAIGKTYKWEKWTLIRAWEYLVGREREEFPNKGKDRPFAPLPETCEGISLRFGEWEPHESQFLIQMDLFTCKSMVYVLNISTREYLRGRAKYGEQLQNYIDTHGGGTMITISAQLEQKLLSLKHEGQSAYDLYMAANPSHKSNINELLFACERSLQLIKFYIARRPEMYPDAETGILSPVANEQCIVSYRCKQGTTAQDAAGLISIELSRYFNRMEMYSIDDLKDEEGDFDTLDETGKHRLQQKRYEVNDGDACQMLAYDVPKDDLSEYKKSDKKKSPQKIMESNN